MLRIGLLLLHEVFISVASWLGLSQVCEGIFIPVVIAEHSPFGLGLSLALHHFRFALRRSRLSLGFELVKGNRFPFVAFRWHY